MSGDLDRRRFLRQALLGGTTLAAGASILGRGDLPLGAITRAGAGPANVDPHLFTLGVASGDPAPTSVTIWTRLAPDPLNGGGLGTATRTVRWEVATDETFAQLVGAADVTTAPWRAHTVKVRVANLTPGRWYWYRFISGDHVSPVGRTRTAPASADSSPLRFGFTSCQGYSAGYYTAHRAIADDDLDLVVWLGDYIYEGPGGTSGVRNHSMPEATTLAGYRNRYALYRLDPDLQAAHASAPWIVTWDDHEVDNDYAGLVPENASEAAAFPARRAAAYRAWWEHIPIRGGAPNGATYRIHRRLRWGKLSNFHVLDGRQYRSDQACDQTNGPMCESGLDPSRTMLGTEQESWLTDGLRASTTKWNFLANQTVFAPLVLAGDAVNLDAWDGYPAARSRLTSALATMGQRNPVILTGDTHVASAGNVHAVPDDHASPVVATEYSAPATTSRPRPGLTTAIRSALDEDSRNEHVRYFDDLARRGYVRCTVSSTLLRADYRYVSTVTTPTATVATGASFHTYPGAPGVVPA